MEQPSAFRRSSPYLRTAERNRLAKLRFLNASTAPAVADATDAGAAAVKVPTWSTQHCVFADNVEPKPQPQPTTVQPNPFTAFLESMDQLRTGQPVDRHADRLMEVLATLEQQQATADETNTEDSPLKDNTNGGSDAATSDAFRHGYGYRNAGTFNGRSQLRVWPSVRRSLSRRASVDCLRDGYASDGGASAN